jgi:hypothetical protein
MRQNELALPVQAQMLQVLQLVKSNAFSSKKYVMHPIWARNEIT